MKVILVAGGSGGHIYPCLELAKFLLNKGEKVLLCDVMILWKKKFIVAIIWILKG